MSETGEPALLCEQLSKHYGRSRTMALDVVSLSVAPGRCLALLGHNGAGKTTLMKLVLGLAAPTGGRVRVLGEDPCAGGAAFRRSIGFLPENVAFDGALPGREIVRFYARLKAVAPAQCDAVLAAVGLAEAADRSVGIYSKGMRQRLGLAQALLGRPRLLLLDEPTSGLDPIFRQAFFAMVAERLRENVTVVLAAHGLAEMEAHVDHVAILHRGRLLACGSLDELCDRAALPVWVRVSTPDSAALKARLGAMPVVRMMAEEITFACPPAEKIALLRRLMALGLLVTDIDLQPPTLSALYRSFVGEETP